MKETQYPVTLEVAYPEKSDRVLALAGLLFMVKAVLLIPHYIVLWVLNILVGIFVLVGYVVVLITGKYNRDLFDFLRNYYQWQMRVTMYLIGLTDVYPPFRLGDKN